MNSPSLGFLERPAQPAAGQQPWLLVLMHGVGSNEQDLFGLAPYVPPQFHVISLRAPFAMGQGAYAWFQFTVDGDGTRHIHVPQEQQARALVQEHLDSGALVAVVTATNAFVTAPIVREFGIHHLVATIPAQEGGSFTGKPRGLPAFKDGKIDRVDAWLESYGLHLGGFERSWFYSDSHNDLPLMGKVSDPIAVDPDDILRAHAGQHAWPVISLR